MSKKLIVLLVEDNPDDELFFTKILKEEYDLELLRVETELAYRNEIPNLKPDIIISDLILPSFDGMSALQIKQEIAPDIPFILTTSALNELVAVESMKAGADDYIIKEHIDRLIPAIESALNKANTEKIKKKTFLL